jgi:succinate dehydrogenase/fumarate reductase cytochrome b subunit
VFNGSVTSYLRVPSFITTLGMLLTLKGTALLITGGAPRGALPPNFRAFGRNFIEDVPLLGRVPWAVIVLHRAVGVFIYLFHYTVLGKQALAVGDNQRAAALAGIHVPLVRITAFVISSLSAVTAGIMLGGFSGVSINVGDGLELGVDLGGGARRRRAAGRPRQHARRPRRRAHPPGPLHAAELPRPAVSHPGDGPRRHHHRRGRLRRLACRPRGSGKGG